MSTGLPHNKTLLKSEIETLWWVFKSTSFIVISSSKLILSFIILMLLVLTFSLPMQKINEYDPKVA